MKNTNKLFSIMTLIVGVMLIGAFTLSFTACEEQGGDPPAAAISGSPITVTAKKANAGGTGHQAANATVTINLSNATVNNALSAANASAWVTPTVAGLSYNANAAAGASAITITIAGTPTVVSSASATITIPAGVVKNTGGKPSTAALAASGNIKYTIGEAALNTPLAPQPFDDITASQLVANIKIGWNLGNTLDTHSSESRYPSDVPGMEKAWGNPVTTQEMIDALKNAGFNGIRIPVSWHKAVGGAPNYTIRADWMARVVDVVNYAASNDMYILLNTHHDEDIFKFTNEEKEASINEFTKIWEQIAATFRNYNEKLIFEGLNEPRTIDGVDEWNGGTADERENLNEHYQAFVDTVRASGGNNDKRILMVNTFAASAGQIAVNGLTLPTDTVENKIIVSIHAYAPYNFAMQVPGQATWSKNNPTDVSGVTSAINPAYNRFVADGIPVVMGEFGAVRDKEDSYRAEWAEYYVSYARSKDIPCFWWDDGGKYKIFDRSSNTFSAPLILEALMNGAESGGD